MTPDPVRQGEGEKARRWTVYACPECGQLTVGEKMPCANHGDQWGPLGVPFEVVEAGAPDAGARGLGECIRALESVHAELLVQQYPGKVRAIACDVVDILNGLRALDASSEGVPGPDGAGGDRGCRSSVNEKGNRVWDCAFSSARYASPCDDCPEAWESAARPAFTDEDVAKGARAVQRKLLWMDDPERAAELSRAVLSAVAGEGK